MIGPRQSLVMLLCWGAIFWTLPVAVSEVTASGKRIAEVPRIEHVRIGFADRYKLGYWVPLRVTLGGPKGDETLRVEVAVPDDDGVPSRVVRTIEPSDPSESALSELRAIEMFVKIGRPSGQLVVRVLRGEELLTKRAFDLVEDLPPALDADDTLLLVLGSSEHLSQTMMRHPLIQAAQIHVAQVSGTDELPRRWYGYEGVDAVVVAGGAQRLSQILAEPVVTASLDEWVRRGGTLLFSVGGDEAQPFLSDSVLPDGWVPGRFHSWQFLTQGGALQRLSGVDAPLEVLTEGDPLRLRSARLVELRGEIVAAADAAHPKDLPLIVQSLHGFGRVVFVAFDLDLPLLSRWKGTVPLVLKLLRMHEGAPRASSTADERLGEVTHAGYDDLSGQLRSALDQFQAQGIRLMPFALLLAIMLAYLLLLGPGDYFLLRRMLGRMEATWITLPLLVALFCGGIYGLARWTKGNQVQLNQVDVVDYDTIGGGRRASTWFTIFSPASRGYDLWLKKTRFHPELAGDQGVSALESESAAAGQAPLDDDLISWQGLPGTGLGGMQSRATPPLSARPYAYDEMLTAMHGVPIAVWSSRGFVARWTPTVEPPVAAELAPFRGPLGGLIVGHIENMTDDELSDALLVTERWAYRLGTIGPRQRLEINDRLAPRSVENQLTRQRDADERYDRFGSDVVRIMELMSFYTAARGGEYSQLRHQYEASLDLSSQLVPGRAVLFATVRGSGTEVYDAQEPLAGTQARRTLIVRVVLKIE